MSGKVVVDWRSSLFFLISIQHTNNTIYPKVAKAVPLLHMTARQPQQGGQSHQKPDIHILRLRGDSNKRRTSSSNYQPSSPGTKHTPNQKTK